MAAIVGPKRQTVNGIRAQPNPKSISSNTTNHTTTNPLQNHNHIGIRSSSTSISSSGGGGHILNANRSLSVANNCFNNANTSSFIRQHHQQQQQQQQQHHVIGTVQSYQILTPDGLQAYPTATATTTKLEPSDLAEFSPYTSLSSTTPHYTFTTHASHHGATADAQQLHQQIAGATTSHTQQQQHQLTAVGGGGGQQQQHHVQQQHHFMELKNDLLIKSAADAYALDASSMYHLPFSPSSMISSVNDVNGQSLLETKEIRTVAGATAGAGNTIIRNANNTVITTTTNAATGNSNKKTTIQPRTVQLLVTRRPIITSANASNTNPTQIIASNSNAHSAGATQTATIVAPGVLKITSTAAPTLAHNHNNQTTMLHTTAAASAANNNSNNNAAAAETVVIEEEDDELLTATSGDEGSISPSALAMSATTAQILRKFRIPKGTALTAKSMTTMLTSDAAAETLICSASTSPAQSPIHSTTSSPPPPADTPNSVDLVEEVIETDENSTCHSAEALMTADTTTADTINECDDMEGEEEEEDEEAAAASIVEAADIGDSSNAETNNAHTATTTTVLVPNNGAVATATALPQIQLQTIQPNGTVTCINLPPNTILLTAPDGSTILAQATPQQWSKLTQQQQQLQQQPQQQQAQQQQQQQIIAIPDWHSSGAGSSVNSTTATVLQAVQQQQQQHQQQQAAATTTQTLLFTADGTAIPLLQSAPAPSSNAASGSTNTAAAVAAAQIIAAQQAEALKAQVLA